MNEVPSSPRVTSQNIEMFEGKHVRLVGKVTQLRGQQATLDSAGLVTINLAQDSHLMMDHYFEVILKVEAGGRLRTLTSTDFGTDFNFAAYEELVSLSQLHKEIFYKD